MNPGPPWRLVGVRCPEHKGDCANAYVGSSEKMAKDLIWLGRLAGVGQRDD